MAIICHCSAVRDRTIVKAVQRGATTLEDVQQLCGAANMCGGCEPAVAELIDQVARSASHGASKAGVSVRPRFGFSA